jgi:hypothetical protein
MHQPLLILDQNPHFQLRRSSLRAHSAFSTCNILVNASHDRLAHQPGPLLPSYSRRSSDSQILSGQSSAVSAFCHICTQASPDLSSRTYVYHSPWKFPSAYIWYIVRSAFGGHCIACPCSHGAQLPLAVWTMIYAVEQLGETNNAPRRHWTLDGGVRQFHGL